PPFPSRARAPQTAHILRDWLISSRVAAYDSPGTTWFTEESNGPPFPVAAAAARPFHPQVLHQVEGPASGPPAAPPVTRHPRGRPLCRHRRCPGLARDRDLWPPTPSVVARLPGVTQRHPLPRYLRARLQPAPTAGVPGLLPCLGTGHQCGPGNQTRGH